MERSALPGYPDYGPARNAPHPAKQFDLHSFSGINRIRCEDGFGHTLTSWSILEWCGAMAGEAGEACNLAKKILRLRDMLKGNHKPDDLDAQSLARRCAEECADVIIYCDLIMQRLGFSTAEVVREMFNRKSDQIGSSVKF